MKVTFYVDVNERVISPLTIEDGEIDFGKDTIEEMNYFLKQFKDFVFNYYESNQSHKAPQDAQLEGQ